MGPRGGPDDARSRPGTPKRVAKGEWRGSGQGGSGFGTRMEGLRAGRVRVQDKTDAHRGLKKLNGDQV